MTWVRLDDQFPDHPKLAQIGLTAPLAGWLYICGLCYCARYLTDGHISMGQVSRLTSFEHIGYETGGIPDLCSAGEDADAKELALDLVSVGLWETIEGGYQVHDYLKYNPSRRTVLAARKRNLQRQQAFRKRTRNAVTNAVRNVSVTVPPSPSPSSLETKKENQHHVRLTTPDPVWEDFDRFYLAYPKHEGRSEARKAWERLGSSRPLVATLISAIDAQRQGKKWREGYIPMPATWLNQRRWEDEVEVASTMSPKTAGNVQAVKNVLAKLHGDLDASR